MLSLAISPGRLIVACSCPFLNERLNCPGSPGQGRSDAALWRRGPLPHTPGSTPGQTCTLQVLCLGAISRPRQSLESPAGAPPLPSTNDGPRWPTLACAICPVPTPRPARRLSFCPPSPPPSSSLSACPRPCAPRPARSFILTSSRPSLRPRSPLLSFPSLPPPTPRSFASQQRPKPSLLISASRWCPVTHSLPPSCSPIARQSSRHEPTFF